MQIHCDVSYDTASDRLVGGDFFRELGNGWARSFLMPAGKAERLRRRLQQLDDAVRAEHAIGDPAPVAYPQVLAIIRPGGLPGAIDGRHQLVPLDLAFAEPPLQAAPAVFRDVAQLVCVVDSPTSLAERQPDTNRGRQELAVNLFGVLRCAHRHLHLALTVGTGSSIEATTVSPAGHLQDPYFLVGPGDVPGIELHRGQHEDVARALNLVAASGGPGERRTSLIDAAKAYWQSTIVPPAVVHLCDQIAADRQPTIEDFGTLAVALTAGGW